MADVEKRPPVAGEVLVKMAYTAISAGTERANLMGGQLGTESFPCELGYSGSGWVKAIGENVTDLRPGDRVITCWSTHRRYNTISRNNVMKIEADNIKMEEAALTLITTFSLAAVRKVRPEIAESGLVVGQGILGAFSVQFMRMAGLYPVIAADTNPERRETALRLGADIALDPAEEGYTARVRELCGGGVDTAVEVTGKGQALNQTLACMKPFGRIALLDCTRTPTTVDFYHDVHKPGIQIFGAHTMARPKLESRPGFWTEEDDCRSSLRLLAAGRLKLKDVIHEIHSPLEATEVYARLANDSLWACCSTGPACRKNNQANWKEQTYMNKKIRVVHFGIAHDRSLETLRCALKYPDVFEIVGICEPDDQMRAYFGTDPLYNRQTWLTEEEFLRRDDIDAVFCEGHELRSVSDAQKCIDRGLHVHLDKPGGTDIKAFEKLIRDAERKNLTLQMGYMYRYNPALRYVIDRVRSGALGVITGIDTSFSTLHDAEKRRWLKQFPGGSMFYIGCHSLDMIMLINGKPTSVHAFNHSSGCDNDGSMDTTFAVLDYPHGACMVRMNSTEQLGYEHRTLKVVGHKGTIEICPLESPTVIRESIADGERNVFPGFIPGRYDAMLLDFARCVRGEVKNAYSGDYEIELQRTLLAAVQ